MRKNVGGYERIVRLVLGGALLYLALSRWRGRREKLAMAAGLELLATSVGQTCPANAAMGRDTYRESEEEDASPMGDLPA